MVAWDGNIPAERRLQSLTYPPCHAATLITLVCCTLAVQGMTEPALSPHLNLSFTATASGGRDARVSRCVALFVPSGVPPTPFLPPGPFSATWTGFLHVDLRDRFTFTFEGTGRFELQINGQPLLRAEGDDPQSLTSRPMRLKKGPNAMRAIYQSPRSGPAECRLYWRSTDFPQETIPPTAFSREGTDESVLRSLERRRGRALFAAKRCIRCHTWQSPSDGAGIMPELNADSPSLAHVGSQFYEEWIVRWLLDPRKVRPDAHMPKLLQGDQAVQDAWAIAAYLNGFTRPTPSLPVLSDEAAIARGGHLYATLGCVGCHVLGGQKVTVPARLPLEHVGSKWKPPALRAFLLQPQGLQQWNRMPDFGLDDQEANDLAAFLSANQDRRAQPITPWPIEGRQSLDRGRKLVATLACANCHEIPQQGGVTTLALDQVLATNLGEGCLQPGGPTSVAAPDFDLSERDRDALVTFLKTGIESLARYSPIEFAERQVTALRCNACHDRDGKTDVRSGHEQEVAHWLSADVARTTDAHAFWDESDIQIDQSRPSLTLIGEKLKPQWLSKMLSGQLAYRLRPWFESRMPSFPTYATALAQGLAMSHGYPPETSQDSRGDTDLAEAGGILVSEKGGFSCTACHGIGAQDPHATFETIGPNFIYVAERLHRDYYQRLMFNPQRTNPRSKMPRYSFDNETTALTTVLGGKASRQFEAIWQYLQAGRALQDVSVDTIEEAEQPPKEATQDD